jgi:hypothetical protein
MDASRFDRLVQTLGTSTRRGALALLLGGALGLLGLGENPPETEAGRHAKRRRNTRHRRAARRRHDLQAKAKKRRKGASAQGPCGNGSAKANACGKGGDCCTGYCKKDRCRCKKLNESCTEDRNCCANHGQPMTCQNQTCQTVAVSPPPSPPVTAQCQPEPASQTCAGRCGFVTNNCGNPIDCGPCACVPACPVCQTCNTANGQCVADPGQNRADCAGSDPNTSICCNGVCCTGCCGEGDVCGACRVFVTADPQFSGDLNGLTGADAICQARANAAGIPGANVPETYLAWLSDDTDSPSTRFRRSGQPYQLGDAMRSQVAANWDALIDTPGNIDHPIDVTEDGDPVAPDFVWSATNFNGTAAPPGFNCVNWTSEVFAPDNTGLLGQTDADDSSWTFSVFGDFCSPMFTQQRLYCFQQR